MKAFVCEQYGPPEVLRLREVAAPIPKNNEVLVRIRATTVTTADSRIRAMRMPRGFGLPGRLAFGFAKPRQPVLGSALAGEIVACGKNVTRFKPGDRVFAMSGMRLGCHAEYQCVPEDGAVAHKPPNLEYAEAAALPFGGTTALDFFRRGRLKKGERILINGASGSVGSAAVQLARHRGAEVTGVCSTPHAELVRALGAQRVIDYTREDFTQSGERYDVIMDIAGAAPFARVRDSLAPGGRLLLVLCGLPEMLKAPWQSLISGKKVIAGPAAERQEDIVLLAELAATGAFKPVIGHCYDFAEMVEAHRRVDLGHKPGNVAVIL